MKYKTPCVAPKYTNNSQTTYFVSHIIFPKPTHPDPESFIQHYTLAKVTITCQFCDRPVCLYWGDRRCRSTSDTAAECVSGKAWQGVAESVEAVKPLTHSRTLLRGDVSGPCVVYYGCVVGRTFGVGWVALWVCVGVQFEVCHGWCV